MQTKSRETLIFIHLPKTGGVTLSDIVSRQYDPSEVFHVRNPDSSPGPSFSDHAGRVEDFLALPAGRRAGFRCILGHMDYGLHEHIEGPCRYLTMLREPVSRVESHFRQYERTTRKTERAERRASAFESFLADHRSEVENLQARFLVGNHDLDPRRNAETQAVVTDRLRKQFMLVGTVDRFDETVVLLRRVMGWEDVSYRRRNASRWMTRLRRTPRAVRGRIQELNRIDAALHAEANDLLDQAIEAHEPTFREDVEHFRANNKIWVPTKVERALAKLQGSTPERSARPERERRRVLIEASKLAGAETDGVGRYVSELVSTLKGMGPASMPDVDIDVMVWGRIYPLQDLPGDLLKDGTRGGVPPRSGLHERVLSVLRAVVPPITAYSVRRLLPDDAFRRLLGKGKDELMHPPLSELRPAQWVMLSIPPVVLPLLVKGVRGAIRTAWMLRLKYAQEPPTGGYEGVMLSLHEWFMRPNVLHALELDDYDLIHLTLPNSYHLLGPVSCPLLVTVHDLSHIHCPQFQNGSNTVTLALGLDRAVRGGARFVTPSEATGRELVESYRVDRETVTTVLHGCRDEVFHPVDDAARLTRVREKYGIESERFLLALGTIEPRKNLVGTLEAFQEVIEEGVAPDVTLVVAGRKGWQTREFARRAKAMGSRVHCPGYIEEEDLAALYSAALGFVYPSHYEGFGLPLLEAMQCGLPVIYGANSAMSEVVGDAGLGVDSNEVHDIASKMRRLLGDEDLRRELGRRALARSAEFTWEAAAASTFAVYRDALASGAEGER